MFAVPNGGSRNPIEASNLKRQGVKAGIPDLIIIYRSRAYGLELKSQTGRLSDAQASMHQALNTAGMPVSIAHSYDQALEAIRHMGIPLAGK